MSWNCYNQHLRADTRIRDQPGERCSVIAQSWLCCRCQVEESFPGEDRCIALTSSGHRNLSSVSAAVNFLLAPFFDYYFFCTVTSVQTLIIFPLLYGTLFRILAMAFTGMNSPCLMVGRWKPDTTPSPKPFIRIKRSFSRSQTLSFLFEKLTHQ